MRKATNSERIEGRVYQHSLTVKTVQNQTSANYGKEFISGDLEVAVDEAGLNVIPVHFTYVTPTTSSGAENRTFTVLKKIIDGGKTWITNGKDEALKVRVDTAIALNDFYTQDGSLVSVKKNEGGFVSVVNGELSLENERNTFTVDMLITGVTRTEKNEEKNIARCLKCLSPYGFEIIVVDTGSSDRTREIAEQYTNNIYDFVWCDDFATAKNFAISKATNQYVMILDSDEFLENIDIQKLENQIREQPDAVGRIYRRNAFMTHSRFRIFSNFYSTFRTIIFIFCF